MSDRAPSKGLVVIHLDGLSHGRLGAALEGGHMPFVKTLIEKNSFERSGDLVVFGAYDGAKQVNFEDQVGGHGSVGGDQLHPFLLAKKEWGLDTTHVTNASDLYPMLVAVRDRT